MIAKRHTLASALRVAATQYDDDALVHGDPGQTPGYETVEGRRRIVRQFLWQADQARKLADAVEEADTIKLED